MKHLLILVTYKLKSGMRDAFLQITLKRNASSATAERLFHF